jgi:hypothetical protein
MVFVGGHIIEFADNGPIEGTIDCIGTYKECCAAVQFINAVAYKGPRMISGTARAYVVAIMPGCNEPFRLDKEE